MEEEKGFVLKDKRAFDDKGELKDEDQEGQASILCEDPPALESQPLSV